MQTKRLLIKGRVQGVNYRASMQLEAESIGISGWVRNLDDGSVEALVCGPEEALEKMIAWARIGPRFAEVESVEVSTGGEFSGSGFSVRF